jgi:hypothetical protein
MNKSLLFIIVICGARFLCGCAAGNTTTTPPPVATHFSVTPATLSSTAGTSFNFSVVAIDSSNNPVSSYSGAVHFTSTDAKAVLPADSTLTNGAGTFSATLKTSGGQIISATSIVSGSSISIAVSAGPASQLAISAPATVVATVPFSFTVRALDSYNNAASSYAGTVHFTSSDTKAILPTNSQLPGGAGIFSATIETVGNQTITATDIAAASITGNSSMILITSPPPLTITSGVPPNGTVDRIYGGNRTKYELCGANGCYVCSRTPFPGTCGNWPPCGQSKPCVATLNLSGFTLQAIGGTPPYIWNAFSLPTGLAVQVETGEVDISGTPPPGSNATYSGVQVTVHDSANPPASVAATYSIVISNPPPPVVSVTPAPADGAINLPYNFAFTATSGQLPYQSWSETGALPPGLSPLTNGGVLSGTPTATGSYPISVSVQDALGQTSTTQSFTISIYSHGFKATGSMSTVRTSYTATSVGVGNVLVAGGWVPGMGPSASAELFHAATESFSATGSMGTARYGHTATMLPDGRVLVTGGTDSNVEFASAELYDPTTGTFTPVTASLGTARAGHTATVLSDHKILFLGGTDNNGNLLTSAELFDPSTFTFAPTGSMGTARSAYTATLLNDGKVIVAGGFSSAGVPLANAELYDPFTGSFSPTGNMTTARAQHTATAYTSYNNTHGIVLAGGTDINGNPLDTEEGFDEVNGIFIPERSHMTIARTRHTATRLSNGPILLIGGDGVVGSQPVELSSAESGSAGAFAPTGSMGIARAGQTATDLGNSKVLVIGGYTEQGYTATSEVYQ